MSINKHQLSKKNNTKHCKNGALLASLSQKKRRGASLMHLPLEAARAPSAKQAELESLDEWFDGIRMPGFR